MEIWLPDWKSVFLFTFLVAILWSGARILHRIWYARWVQSLRFQNDDLYLVTDDTFETLTYPRHFLYDSMYNKRSGNRRPRRVRAVRGCDLYKIMGRGKYWRRVSIRDPYTNQTNVKLVKEHGIEYVQIDEPMLGPKFALFTCDAWKSLPRPMDPSYVKLSMERALLGADKYIDRKLFHLCMDKVSKISEASVHAIISGICFDLCYRNRVGVLRRLLAESGSFERLMQPIFGFEGAKFGGNPHLCKYMIRLGAQCRCDECSWKHRPWKCTGFTALYEKMYRDRSIAFNRLLLQNLDVQDETELVPFDWYICKKIEAHTSEMDDPRRFASQWLSPVRMHGRYYWEVELGREHDSWLLASHAWQCLWMFGGNTRLFIKWCRSKDITPSLEVECAQRIELVESDIVHNGEPCLAFILYSHIFVTIDEAVVPVIYLNFAFCRFRYRRLGIMRELMRQMLDEWYPSHTFIAPNITREREYRFFASLGFRPVQQDCSLALHNQSSESNVLLCNRSFGYSMRLDRLYRKL